MADRRDDGASLRDGRGSAQRVHAQSAARDNHLRYVSTVLRANIVDLIGLLDLGPGQVVIYFGCAHQPYRAALPVGTHYVGADLPGNPEASIDVADDGTLPVAGSTLDAVLSRQVLEHVEDPATYLREAHRVLRPGGRLLLATHGMMAYHSDPVDWWRWTGAGLRHAVELAGLPGRALPWHRRPGRRGRPAPAGHGAGTRTATALAGLPHSHSGRRLLGRPTTVAGTQGPRCAGLRHRRPTAVTMATTLRGRRGRSR